jgi:hypothetical protein
MKGNDGRAARRKTSHRFAVVAAGIMGGLILLCVLGVLPVPFGAASSGDGEPYRKKAARLLRDPTGHHHDGGEAAAGPSSKKTARQFRNSYQNQFDGHDEAQVLKKVLAAELQLVDITVVEEELLRAPANSYAGIYGKFCTLDWTLRKKDPSAGAHI